MSYGEDEVEATNETEAVDQFEGEDQMEMGSLNNMEDPYDHTVVEGTLLIFNTWGTILFDSSVSHSFISTSFACALGLVYEFL